MTAICKIKLENRIEEIQRFEMALTEFARIERIPDDISFSLRLCIDELFTNIVSYGYQDDERHIVELEITVAEGSVRIDLTDDAVKFDPLADAPEPDIDADLEDRKVGGVGIHLVKTLMDETNYIYEDGKNRLRLIKNLPT